MDYEWLIVPGVSVGLTLLAIIDLFRSRVPTWHRARQNRPLWIVLSIVLGPLGVLLYLTGPRLVLKRTVRHLRADALTG